MDKNFVECQHCGEVFFKDDTVRRGPAAVCVRCADKRVRK